MNIIVCSLHSKVLTSEIAQAASIAMAAGENWICGACASKCVCMFVHLYVCMCVHVFVLVCVCMHVRVRLCASVCVFVDACDKPQECCISAFSSSLCNKCKGLGAETVQRNLERKL